VVVGDDYVDREFIGAPHDFRCANAGVHADNQLDAVGGGLFHRVGAHPVAIAQPVRDEELGRAPRHFDRFFEDDHGGGAIHVVIAIDQDALAVRYGAPQPRDGFGHAAQRPGRVQIGEGGQQEAARGFRIAKIACQQDARGRQADIQCRRQRLGFLVLCFGNQPAGLNGHAARQLFEK